MTPLSTQIFRLFVVWGVASETGIGACFLCWKITFPSGLIGLALLGSLLLFVVSQTANFWWSAVTLIGMVLWVWGAALSHYPMHADEPTDSGEAWRLTDNAIRLSCLLIACLYVVVVPLALTYSNSSWFFLLDQVANRFFRVGAFGSLITPLFGPILLWMKEKAQLKPGPKTPFATTPNLQPN